MTQARSIRVEPLTCSIGAELSHNMIWANMALAYAKLAEATKTQIAGLRARHSIEASFGAALPIEKRLALQRQYPDAEHPVVRTHPETGDFFPAVRKLERAGIIGERPQ